MKENSIAQAVQRQVGQFLADSGSGVGLMEIPLDDVVVAVGVVQSEQLSLEASQLTIRVPALQGADFQKITAVAEQILRRRRHPPLTTLTHSESDSVGDSSQLRTPPETDDDGTLYYELLLVPGEITLQRMHNPVGSPRRRVNFALTREQFSGMIADLVEAITEED